MTKRDLAQSERAKLCDLLGELGPEAPTLCEGWTTSHMAAHLFNRERRPLTGPGLVVGGPFARYTDSQLEKTRASHPYVDLVAAVRSGPPRILGSVDGAMNITEYFVHHEDVRRASGDVEPRSDVGELDETLWEMQGRSTKFLTRHLDDLDLTLARPNGEQRHVGGGSRPVTLVGSAPEIVLFLSGRRDAAVVEIEGEPAATRELREGRLGL
jgi:uncharacterized protein (TIGR03085 family)